MEYSFANGIQFQPLHYQRYNPVIFIKKRLANHVYKALSM
jgi:hypothetical protein